MVRILEWYLFFNGVKKAHLRFLWILTKKIRFSPSKVSPTRRFSG